LAGLCVSWLLRLAEVFASQGSLGVGRFFERLNIGDDWIQHFIAIIDPELYERNRSIVAIQERLSPGTRELYRYGQSSMENATR
jgi:hypothetical protein